MKPDPLTKEEQRVYEAFIDLMYNRTTLDHFCRTSNFKDAEALESLLASRDKTLIGKPLSGEEFEKFKANLQPFVSAFAVDAPKVTKAIAEAVHGYKTIQPLFEDEDIEEIIINRLGEDILIVHRKYGTCRTNLTLRTEHERGVLLSQLGADDSKPFADIHLPDGCRANVTFEPAAEQTAVTIRKFRYKPLSIVDMIKNGTMDSDLAAFLWLSTEGLSIFPLNIMIVGGTASGKTTTLNAIAGLIPPHERIISIEDTMELNLAGRENWVRLESSPKADLEDLVRNSLRMRPDRLIVGEIRGREAEDLFTAMNVGHRGSLATIHANSDRDCVKRLESQPMTVPRGLIPLLDIIVVQHRIRDRKTSRMVRRVMQVSEVSRIENEIALNPIYDWDTAEETLKQTPLASQTREKLAKATGRTIRQISEELENRRKMLDYLLEKNITEHSDVCKFMQTYYAEMTPKIT